MARVAAIVTIKGLAEAKSRLAGTLGPSDRTALAFAMFRDVVAAVAACKGIWQRLVVSPDGEVLTEARARGFLPLQEEGAGGMNRAFELGLAATQRLQARAAVLVPADLPLLTSSELGQVVSQLREPCVVAVPSPTGGTNLLGIRPLGGLPLHFEEPGSCQLHLQEATRMGLRGLTLHLPGASLDVDVEADLPAAAASPGHAGSLLRRLGVVPA